MQPYQEASEESYKQSYRPFQAAATAAVPVAKAAIGGKVMSLINKYIPESLAMKGLSKIDPRLGKFMALGQEMGHSFDELKSFLGERVQESEKEEAKPAKAERNIIEKESPELHQYIFEQIKKGMNPLKAATGASFDKSNRFSKAIEKLEKQHNKPFYDIVREVYGAGERSLPKQGFAQEETERFQNQYGEQPQGQQQSGQGQQALMAVLQKINQKLGQ
jgi:hypothetical protein